MQTGLFALLPQIVRGVRIPVISAGGIADGRGIAAALMLGASGVQIGTAFLRCPEAAVHPDHRAALATAHDDGTRLTRLFSGRPARVIRNRYTEALKDVDDLAFPFPIQASVSGPLRQGADASTSPRSLLARGATDTRDAGERSGSRTDRRNGGGAQAARLMLGDTATKRLPCSWRGLHRTEPWLRALRRRRQKSAARSADGVVPSPRTRSRAR